MGLRWSGGVTDSQYARRVTESRAPLKRAAIDVLLYTLARLVLVAVLTLVIYGLARALGLVGFPGAVALLLGLIVAMPLGMWVFSPLRRRATASLAVVGERRRRERERLQARLRGEVPADAAAESHRDDAADTADAADAEEAADAEVTEEAAGTD